MQSKQAYRSGLWVAAGGYLMYIAWKLFSGTVQSTWMVAVAVVFGLCGMVLLVMGLLKMWRVTQKIETSMDADSFGLLSEETPEEAE